MIPRLSVRGLGVTLGTAVIVEEVALEIAAGQMMGLVGESGSGKSMTALALLGLLPDGRVRRGLALFEVNRGGAAMIEPAPNTLAEPGI